MDRKSLADKHGAGHHDPAEAAGVCMSVATQVVKKFINDPENVVPEALAGNRAPPIPIWCGSISSESLVIRADAPVQGKVG